MEQAKETSAVTAMSVSYTHLVDVGMLLHSSCDTVVNDISYSKTDLRVHFYGKKSHAATWPEEGISALTPVDVYKRQSDGGGHGDISGENPPPGG